MSIAASGHKLPLVLRGGRLRSPSVGPLYVSELGLLSPNCLPLFQPVVRTSTAVCYMQRLHICEVLTQLQGTGHRWGQLSTVSQLILS